MNDTLHEKVRFVDAFAGCGGLSLGLMQAGLEGLFAIEHDQFAFETLRQNLLSPTGRHLFSWPEWLPQAPIPIGDLLVGYHAQLEEIAGSVGVLSGGPPCQGFSTAGRRKHNDPRNQLFASYVELVSILKPKAVVIENVRGFTLDFQGEHRTDNYAGKLRKALSREYEVYQGLLDLSQFGVPQARTRYFLLAFKPGVFAGNPFELLRQRLPSYLRMLGLRAPVTSWAAISDLEMARGGTRPSTETPGFSEINYAGPLSRYQLLMNTDVVHPTDLRLARHSSEIANRFARIIALSDAEGRLNRGLRDDLRTRFGLKKKTLRVLDPSRPAPTITSMPDDLIHYREPRTLTVRENARLQGFPDWFSFHGKYTTGGLMRRKEVPRFTQVANAVPPLVARAIGEMLLEVLATVKEPAHPLASTHSFQRPQQRAELST